MSTLRERIEDAIQEIDLGEPEAARVDLEAALAMLDSCTKRHGKGNYTWLRLVPDPENPDA